MNLRGRTAPIWLMGLSNLSFGFFAGFITVPLPQLLAAQHVPEAQIASITATVFSGGIGVFLLGPMLDVRFSRRFYATLFAALAALCLTSGLLYRTHLQLLELLMLLGFASAQLCTNALGGWLATIVHHHDESKLSSATTYGLFNASSLIPLIYMQVIDGRAYTTHGVTGTFLADAALSLIACALLALLLFSLRRQPKAAQPA